MKKNKKAIIIITILLVCFIAVLAFYKYHNDNSNNEILENSTEKEGIVKEEDKTSGDKVALSYSNIVSVDLANKKVSLYIKNPGRSIKKIKIDVVLLDGDNRITIASSEVIDIGYAVYSLDLTNEEISTGKYSGEFVITYLDDDSDEADMVNTVIDTKITVK